jgi:hypothetical protein
MSDNPNDSFGFEPIAPHRIKKAKKTKIILIITIIILIAALGGLAFLGYSIFKDGSTTNQGTINTPSLLPDDTITDENAPGEVKVEETSIPNLTSLFGLPLEEAKAVLGANFQLLKTDEVTDDTNPKIKKLAHFSYVPSVQSDNPNAVSAASLPSENIYLSLDEGDKVIDIYYTCDMRLLGYPEKSFLELLATDEVVTGALRAAGVEPRDFGFAPPTEEESISYDNPNSENRKVVKQSTLYSGRTSTEEVPTAWTVTVTYDYGAGVASTSEFRQATRTISLRLA